MIANNKKSKEKNWGFWKSKCKIAEKSGRLLILKEPEALTTQHTVVYTTSDESDVTWYVTLVTNNLHRHDIKRSDWRNDRLTCDFLNGGPETDVTRGNQRIGFDYARNIVMTWKVGDKKKWNSITYGNPVLTLTLKWKIQFTAWWNKVFECKRFPFPT